MQVLTNVLLALGKPAFRKLLVVRVRCIREGRIVVQQTASEGAAYPIKLGGDKN